MVKITRLHIENFRAIKTATLEELSDVVVIAGPNGCGKSCIFDAIRLLKSIYGGYRPNEYQQWFGEFQINLSKWQYDAKKLFQDIQRPLLIQIGIELASEEREFIKTNVDRLLEPIVWRKVAPETGVSTTRSPIAREIRQYGDDVEKQTKEESALVIKALRAESFDVEFAIDSTFTSNVTESPVMELVFSVYEPPNIGVIDFHGAHRDYKREGVGSINLSIESTDQKSSQHALYNYIQKYSNIKSEMATSYVKELLAREANVELQEGAPLISTLQDLFSLFFPGKTFGGPQPRADGRLSFPVRLASGGEHDIDGLSSGEKEVLYGYLRLRNTAPRNSVLLLDEPELHLNPRLIRGLPQFYHQNLGKALGNQIWLNTHSDAFLREAVYQPGFSIFHMQGPDTVKACGNQIQAVTAAEALDRAVMDLVGASYRPGAKVVIFEGGGDAEFDVRMVCRLFPEFEKSVNPISGGDKGRVHHLHKLLREASEKGRLETKFFCINDRDTDETVIYEDTFAFRWDVYHIENYLLNPRYIWRVLRDLNWLTVKTQNEAAVATALKECAESTLDDLVRHRMEFGLNRSMVACIRTAIPRGGSNISLSLHEAATASLTRLNELLTQDRSQRSLKKDELKFRNRLRNKLKKDGWKKEYRGKDILALFAGNYINRKGFQYEDLRELIVSRMVDDKFQPEGMKRIISKILEA